MSRNGQIAAWARRCARCVYLLVCCLVAARAEAQSFASKTNSSDTNETRATVIISQNARATYDLQPVPEVIQSMVRSGITNLTGKPNVSQAWLSLVSKEDTVGIKVFSAPGPNSGTRPAVVAEIVQELLDAGIPPKQVVVWDRRLVDLRLAGFTEFETRFGIRVAGALEAGYDEKTYYEAALLGPMNWTDVEFNQKGPSMGRKSYVSRLVTQQLTKIINVCPMMHHNVIGVNGLLYSLTFGSVDNTLRFENNRPEINKAIPEIYALPVFGDKVAGEKVAVSIVDALICQYAGQEQGLLHYSTVLNQLRFSHDPVALDTLSLIEMNRQSKEAGQPVMSTNFDLLNNAAILEIGVSDTNCISTVKVE